MTNAEDGPGPPRRLDARAPRDELPADHVPRPGDRTPPTGLADRPVGPAGAVRGVDRAGGPGRDGAGRSCPPSPRGAPGGSRSGPAPGPAGHGAPRRHGRGVGGLGAAHGARPGPGQVRSSTGPPPAPPSRRPSATTARAARGRRSRMRSSRCSTRSQTGDGTSTRSRGPSAGQEVTGPGPNCRNPATPPRSDGCARRPWPVSSRCRHGAAGDRPRTVPERRTRRGPGEPTRSFAEYLLRNRAGRRYVAAVDSWFAAGPFVSATGGSFLPMGGRNGTAPVPTTSGARRLVSTGQLRCSLLTHYSLVPGTVLGAGTSAGPELRVRSTCRSTCQDVSAGALASAARARGGSGRSPVPDSGPFLFPLLVSDPAPDGPPPCGR